MTIKGDIVAAAALAMSAVLAGCGSVSPPGSASKHSTVPAQAVNENSVGIIRLRFKGSSQEARLAQVATLEGWLRKHGLEFPKINYFLERLAEEGYDTVLAVIPGDLSAFAGDVGFYVGGDPKRTAEDLGKVILETVGTKSKLKLGAAESLKVLPVGGDKTGWFYIGLNGDGVIEGADDSNATRMSEMLDLLGDQPACIAIPIDGLDAALGDLVTDDQSRLVRRLRAVAGALDDAVALSIAISKAGRTEVVLAYPDPELASHLDKALAQIRGDMEIALKGSLRQKELTEAEAERERRIINALRARQEGSTVVLYTEGQLDAAPSISPEGTDTARPAGN